MRARPRQGGYTLLEVLAVAAIAVGLIAVSGVGIRRLRQSDLRTASAKLAGALRFTYDRSVTTGKYYRMVIDLDEKTYWPEISDDRFYMVRGRGKLPQPEDEIIDPNAPPGATPAAVAKTSGSGLGSVLGMLGGGSAGAPGTVAARVGLGKARFAPDAAAAGKQRSAPLKGVTITAVWTPRLDEPATQGRAYLYFYPEGMTERAIIHLADTSDGAFSLVVHPLTGRVQIVGGKVDLPRPGAGDVDDSGEARP
jgi:general secretion pathway protein H